MLKRLELPMMGVAATLLLVTSWPRGPTALAAHAEAWQPPPDDGACGADVALVGLLPDPDDVSDKLGETVWLRNREPFAVSLDGWSLASGRGRRELDGEVVAAGEAVALVGPALAPVRLANRGGALRLTDACGITTRVAWPELAPGEALLDANERAPPPVDDAREHPMSRDGGTMRGVARDGLEPST